MTTQQSVLQAIREPPDDATVEEILDAVLIHFDLVLVARAGRTLDFARHGFSAQE